MCKVLVSRLRSSAVNYVFECSVIIIIFHIVLLGFVTFMCAGSGRGGEDLPCYAG